MAKTGPLTRILAIAGTALAWFPILAAIVLSLMHLVRAGQFLLDYLIPAEIFPVVLVGGGLLVWAAMRARSHRVFIGLSLCLAVVLVVGGQALAVSTGLASGAIEPEGLWFTLVVAALVGYDLAVMAVGVGGVLLLRHLYGGASEDL